MRCGEKFNEKSDHHSGDCRHGSRAPSAHAVKTITINTNTAGELADACGVKPSDPGAGTKQTFCQGFAQGAISVELSSRGYGTSRSAFLDLRRHAQRQ